MTKKIFQSIMAVAGAVLIASLVIIVGCLYVPHVISVTFRGNSWRMSCLWLS